MLMTALLPAACSDDDDEGVPEEIKASIRGNFHGTCGAVCMLNYRDTLKVNSDASVDANFVNIETLPVASLLDSILGKGTAEENSRRRNRG